MKLRKILIITGICFIIAQVAIISMIVADGKTVHGSIKNREHTHYTKMNVDFKKETCIDFYDNGSWYPVYVCEAR